MKGSAYVWFVILALMFAVILVYNVFSETLSIVSPEVRTFINNTNSSMAGNATATLDTVEVVWRYWPLFFILGLLIWGIVASQRQEPVYYGGE